MNYGGENTRAVYRPLTQDDLISTSVFNRARQSFPEDIFSDDFFRGFVESRAFGLMEIRLVVTAFRRGEQNPASAA